jgi:uncharacterized protein YdhG (YjbR/CyaY superfamily)
MSDTKTTTARGASASGWTDEERAAMKEHVAELKKEKSRGGKTSAADGLADLLEKIAKLPAEDQAMAERIHSVVMAAAPHLAPRTWYGMPAWALDGKVLCFFTPASKFKERYSSFGFNAVANLDDGTMWPTSWAITKLSKADEQRIGELVKRATS